jgi:hypothetical protein
LNHHIATVNHPLQIRPGGGSPCIFHFSPSPPFLQLPCEPPWLTFCSHPLLCLEAI